MIDENNFTELLHVKQLSMFQLHSNFQIGIVHYNVAKKIVLISQMCVLGHEIHSFYDALFYFHEFRIFFDLH